MLQKYCIALEDIVYWAQLSARAAPRRTGPDTGQDKMLREGKIMVTSLYQSLCNMETIYADHVAIRYYDEAKQGVTEVYYRQYAQDLRRFVSFLRSKAGDVKGQRVAILARNSYHYVICMYGTVLAGGVAVPLNMGKSWDEIQYELDLVEPVCVLQDGEYLQREPALADAYSAKLEPMDAFTAFAPAQDVKEVEDLAAMAFIMFTSGTTGRSKGVMLSQKNLFAAMPAFLDPFDDVRKATGWDTDKFCSLSALPMFHISAMTSLVSWSITGHCINLCNDLKYFYRDIGAMHSEVMAVVPVLLKSLYKDVMKGRRDRLNGLCVLTCGAAMFDPQMLKDLMDKGFFIAQMYGLTETCGDGAWNSSQEEKHLTSVGHVDNSCEYKLDDGELCMRGPNAIYNGMFECLGAAGITMDWNDIYTSLSQNVCQGCEGSPVMLNASKLQDNAKYLAITNHIIACVYFFFNTDWLESLPEDVRTIVTDCVKEAVDYQESIDDDAQKDALEQMKNDGVEVTEPADIQAWKDVCAPMLDEYRAKGDAWAKFTDLLLSIK